MTRKIQRLLFVILIAFILGFYYYDIQVNLTDPKENLFKMLSSLCICIAGLLRTGSRGRNSLEFYESQYSKQIGQAFINEFMDRKKLLCAIRLYNENNYRKAVKYLMDLKTRCKETDDYKAVYLFLALTFTDMQLYQEAIHLYQQLIDMNLESTTIYGNLGSIYSTLGEFDNAIQSLDKSLELDDKNPYAYNNIAQLYFNNYNFSKAIEYAKKSLEINHKVYQASTLLAIIYSLLNNEYEAEKYSHMAITSGQNPNDLKNAIEYYKSIN